MFDIHNILKELSKIRPVFHSEADFQHALAWQIHQRNPNYNIRLEKPEKSKNNQIHLDLIVYTPHQKIGIELKYKTLSLIPDKSIIQNPDCYINNESFQLKNQLARNHGRYDFIKDIHRLECLILEGKITKGFAIFLSNDKNYWRNSGRDSMDKNFRIHDKHILKGTLYWNIKKDDNTQKLGKRLCPISLQNDYKLNWRDYSDLSKINCINNQFRYLVVEIKKPRP